MRKNLWSPVSVRTYSLRCSITALSVAGLRGMLHQRPLKQKSPWTDSLPAQLVDRQQRGQAR